MTGSVKILDASGHTTIEFDTEVPESMEVVRERIARATEKEGKKLFKVDPSTKKGDLIEGTWNPEEDPNVLLVPPIAGG